MLLTTCSRTLVMFPVLVNLFGNFSFVRMNFFLIISILRTGGSPCGGGQQIIIHGWARNAPALSLPDGRHFSLLPGNENVTLTFFSADVGFAVGRNTAFKHIVVNLHYLAILKNDFSGNQILLSRKALSDDQMRKID